MKNFFTLLLLFSSFFGYTQTTIVSFSGINSKNFPPTTPPPSGVTCTNLVAGSGITSITSDGCGTPANPRMNVGSWATSQDANYSETFTLNVTTGNILNISNIALSHRRTSAGPTDYNLKIGTSNNTGTTSTTCATSLSVNTNITLNGGSSLTITLYYWKPAGGSGGNLDFNDIVVTGSLTLPVSLTKFNAFFQNRQVNLNWSIANASNFDRFEVEHSTNGVDFTTLQSISTRNTVDYATTDANPAKGINYYRLKMMDLDGRFSYSEVKTVKVASETVWSVSPTKSTSFLTATVNENDESTIQLFNTSGQMVYHSTHNGSPKVEIPISNLTSGIYIVRISVSDNIVYSERIIKE